MENTNTVTILTAEYAELLEARIMLKAIKRVYEARQYISESEVRSITGWKEPSDKEVDVPDVFNDAEKEAE